MNDTTKTLYRLSTDDPDNPTVDYDTLQQAMTVAQETHDEWCDGEWWLKETLVWEAPEADHAHLLLQAHSPTQGGWWGIEAVRHQPTNEVDPEQELAEEWAERLQESLDHDDYEDSPEGWEAVVVVRRVRS